MTEEEIRERAGRIKWRHPIQLTPEFNTRPARLRKYKRRIGHLALPDDLAGWSALDIGAYDGLLSFELEKRGASVVAADCHAWDTLGRDGFDLAVEALGSSVRPLWLNIEDFEPSELGTFDLVLLAGVLYHMRNPLLVLQNLRKITNRVLVIDTHTMVPAFHANYPIIGFFPGDYDQRLDRYEIGAYATVECLRRMIETAGFSRAELRYESPYTIGKKIRSMITNRPGRGRAVFHCYP